MDTTGIATLKALVAFYHEGDEANLLQFLTDKNRESVMKLSLEKCETLNGLLPNEEAVKSIHYSWIVPAIKQYPEKLQGLFLGSLPDSIQKKAQKHFPTLQVRKDMSSVVRRFFNSHLYSLIYKEKTTPDAFTPKTELSQLLSYNKRELLNVIDYLGIWDLTAEFKQIIDKSLLKSIMGQLSPTKREYLRQSIDTHSPTLPTSSLPLRGLVEDEGKLHQMLHNRGLKRLGVALVNEPDSIRWQITRTLDTGRADFMEKYFAAPESKGSAPQMTSQVLSVLNFLKKQSVT